MDIIKLSKLYCKNSEICYLLTKFAKLSKEMPFDKALTELVLTFNDKQALKETYRRLAKIFHPDAHPEATPKEIKELNLQFNEITKMYKTFLNMEEGKSLVDDNDPIPDNDDNFYGDDEPVYKPEIKYFTSKVGLLCAIMKHNMGHFCAYIRIPESNPFYGIEDTMAYMVNGIKEEITYTDIGIYGRPTTPGEFWVGFDTGHFGSSNDINDVVRATEKLAKQLYDFEKSGKKPISSDEYYSSLR